MRKALVAALALLAIAVVAAPAASASEPNLHRFVGSANVEPKFTGEGEFELKPFIVECETVKSKGSGVATFPSTTLTAVVKYSHCEAEAEIAKAEYEFEKVKVTPVTFVYHSNGFAEIGSGGTVKEGKLEGAGPIEITVKGVFKCTISVQPGTYPATALNKPEAQFEAVSYSNKEETVLKGKESLLVKRLGIANAFTHVPYELEGEFCEALPKTEYTAGKIDGSLEASIKNGQIGWE